MARQRTHEETRAYMRRLRRTIAAARPPVRTLTVAEEADRALSVALLDIRAGAPFGYVAGARLEDYRRVEALGVALAAARALGIADLDARTAAAVETAGAITEPWRGWWE